MSIRIKLIALVFACSANTTFGQSIKDSLKLIGANLHLKVGTSFGFQLDEPTITSSTSSKFSSPVSPSLAYGIEYSFSNGLRLGYHHIANYYVIKHSDITLEGDNDIEFYSLIKAKYINDLFSLAFSHQINDLFSLQAIVGYSISLTSLFTFKYGIKTNFALTDSYDFNPNFEKRFDGIVLGGGFELLPFKKSKKKIFNQLNISSMFTFNLRKATTITYQYSFNDLQRDYNYSYSTTPRLINWTILLKYPLLKPRFKRA